MKFSITIFSACLIFGVWNMSLEFVTWRIWLKLRIFQKVNILTPLVRSQQNFYHRSLEKIKSLGSLTFPCRRTLLTSELLAKSWNSIFHIKLSVSLRRVKSESDLRVSWSGTNCRQEPASLRQPTSRPLISCPLWTKLQLTFRGNKYNVLYNLYDVVSQPFNDNRKLLCSLEMRSLRWRWGKGGRSLVRSLLGNVQ